MPDEQVKEKFEIHMVQYRIQWVASLASRRVIGLQIEIQLNLIKKLTFKHALDEEKHLLIKKFRIVHTYRVLFKTLDSIDGFFSRKTANRPS